MGAELITDISYFMRTKEEIVPYKVQDAFMLRAPLLPLSILKKISRSSSMSELLRDHYSSKTVAEALYLASPNLFKHAEEWIDAEDDQESNEKLKYTLLKYLIRMSSRCTPFGMFAGISPGAFGESNKVNLKPAEEHDLHVRPDMQFLCNIAGLISADRGIREKLSFRPNTSLVKTGEEYRYVEYLTDDDGLRRYRLQSVHCTKELEVAIKRAGKGAGIIEMASSITDGNVSLEDASDFIHVLIDNQVLVSGLEPVVTGEGFFNELKLLFRSLAIKTEHISLLEKIDDELVKIQAAGKTNRIKVFNSIMKEVKGAGVPFQENLLIQADMKLSCRDCQLSNNIKQDLQEVLPILMKLSRPAKTTLLDEFRDAFVRRYEGQEVPLTLALDTEAGPGYLPDDHAADASTLLEGLKIPQKISDTLKFDWYPTDRMLYQKLQEALITGRLEVEITDEDMNAIPDPSQDFPMSFSVLARIYGIRDERSGRRLIQLDAMGGSSAANLAGRFCYLDKKLENIIKDTTFAEQAVSGETILAEIVHLPQQRTGNILLRPVLREYEIPYLARAKVNHEFSIPVSDLMISVRQDKILLRSRRLNKYISPRLSNAHNYSIGSLSVYRFLCDMQTQNIQSNLGFSWGPLESDTTFLPRVRYKNFILQPATWNINKKELKDIGSANGHGALQKSIEALRNKYKLPREVLLTKADNELWIDLGAPNCRELFRNEIRNMGSVTLQEFIYEHDKPLVQGEDGSYANEFVFFIHQDR